MDDGDDVGADTRWMTYAELASRLGVEVDSAKRRVARAGWRRQAGNDGRVRVAVPLTLAKVEVDTSISKDSKDGRQTDGGGVDSAASVSPLALRMLAAAEAAAEAARAALAERTRELAEARETVARREGELAGLREALRVAEAAVAEVKDRAEKARGEAQTIAQMVAENERRAAVVRREADEAQATLARLRQRGWLARLLNREG